MKIEVGKTYEVLKDWIGYEAGEKITIVSIGEDKICVFDPEFDSNSMEDASDFLKMELREVDTSKPAHYDTAIDTLAFAKANFSREQVEGFMRINAIKYLQRVKKGQILDDLKKSRSYIDMLIEMEEGK